MTTIPADKLDKLVSRWETVQGALASGADQETYVRLSREFAELNPIVATITALRSALREREGLQYLIDDPASETDMAALAEEELGPLDSKIEELEQQLKVQLLPKDEADEKSAILEVRAGTGGEEAALFAADLFRMYSRYAEKKHWKVELLDSSPTDLKGFKEIVFSVNGDSVLRDLRYEMGGHRVQRVPETEAQGRIHTSACTVAIMAEAEDVDIDIRPDDLKIDVYRSSGAGGQHVNTTDSAVRITHLPTGTVVACQEERSQIKNRATAMKVLKTRILATIQQAQDDKMAADRKQQVGSGDRSERIRTYNFPQGRMTDHRIGLTLYRLDSIMAGDMGEIADALRAHYQMEVLKAQSEGN